MFKFTLGDSTYANSNSLYNNKIEINYVYLVEQSNHEIDNSVGNRRPVATKKTYSELLGWHKKDAIMLLNNETISTPTEIVPAITAAQGLYSIPATPFLVSIYKREIWIQDNILKGQTKFDPVIFNTNVYEIFDHNVKNRRDYEYLIYLSEKQSDGQIKELQGIRYPVHVEWSGWTLTELYQDPTTNDVENKIFKIKNNDVWKFRYNVSTGEVAQNMQKNKVETLSAFPVFSHGPTNHLSGQVECLLGDSVLPYNYNSFSYDLTQQTNKSKFVKNATAGYNAGGYQEKVDRNKRFNELSSNAQADLLYKWRQFCFSGNPKLLKDQFGQSFIVQIDSSSNTTQEQWTRMPNYISFSWTEIEDAKKYKIVFEG